MTKGRVSVLLIAVILLIDQAVKIWVKTHMTLHECIPVCGWFKILFIENNGMAYGLEIGSKLLLSLLRVVLIVVISVYVRRQLRANAKMGYIVCLSMIIAGAAGNIVDGMFYGLVFSASSDFYTSYFVPFGSGYAPFMMGKVVDMLYFPIIETTWPEWMPLVGGQEFIFFSPVFNIADSSISVGVALLLLFYRKELSEISLSGRTAEKTEDQGNKEPNG